MISNLHQTGMQTQNAIQQNQYTGINQQNKTMTTGKSFLDTIKPSFLWQPVVPGPIQTHN